MCVCVCVRPTRGVCPHGLCECPHGGLLPPGPRGTCPRVSGRGPRVPARVGDLCRPGVPVTVLGARARRRGGCPCAVWLRVRARGRAHVLVPLDPGPPSGHAAVSVGGCPRTFASPRAGGRSLLGVQCLQPPAEAPSRCAGPAGPCCSRLFGASAHRYRRPREGRSARRARGQRFLVLHLEGRRSPVLLSSCSLAVFYLTSQLSHVWCGSESAGEPVPPGAGLR